MKAIERGARSPGDDTLDSIAAALAVDPSHNITGSTRADSRVHASIPAISAAVAAYDVPADVPPLSLHRLATAVAQLTEWRLAAQYARIAEHAPLLLTHSLTALHHCAGAERPRAAQLLAATARSADAVAYKFGHRDLPARLVDLMRWAADQTEDRIAQATTAYVRTETFFAARAHTQGLAALEHAMDAGPSPVGRATTAARGALHMRAAVIAGRAENPDAAEHPAALTATPPGTWAPPRAGLDGRRDRLAVLGDGPRPVAGATVIRGPRLPWAAPRAGPRRAPVRRMARSRLPRSRGPGRGWSSSEAAMPQRSSGVALPGRKTATSDR
ncbi:hypothetical protein ABZ760_01275 [Streptomyces sp. NPDC006658]|uniref:hypothetical protein n=1 Tax=Streptomyces sp. NPDC006658 TaxID=3156900 RepID=UPI0033EFE8A2